MNASYAHKTVLVTGATGLIGSHLVPYLLAQGAYVIALGRSMGKLQRTFSTCKSERLTLMEWNVKISFTFLQKPVDYIFHAAGIISGQAIKEHPTTVIHTNLAGLTHCFEALNRQRASGQPVGKLIVFSSVTVYGNNYARDITVSEPDTALSVSLDTSNSSYVESKRMSEVMAQAYWQEMHIPCVRVRFSYVYGPTVNVPKTAFYEFVQDVLSGKDIVMNNSTLPRRDNIYVDDAVYGLAVAALRGSAGEAYNISSGGDGNNFAAIDEMAMQLAASHNLASKDKVIVRYKNGAPAVREPGIIVDNAKLKALGWKPKVDLLSGCKCTLDFYRGR